MLITSALIASGAVYLGQQLRNKKKKLGTALVIHPKQSTGQRQHKLAAYLPPLVNQLLKTENPTEEERMVNHYLKLASGTLALSAFMYLFYAPLAWITVPLSLYIAIPIFQDACQRLFKEKRLRASTIDALIIAGTAFMGYYFAMAIGSVLYYTGRKVLLITEDNSLKNLTNLFGEQPHTVWRIVDGVEVETPFEALQRGDEIVINAGEMVPVDGRIVTGYGSLDQHKLTGESKSAEKGPADQVFATTMLLSGRIQVEVEKTGRETVAAQIGEVLKNTSDFRSLIEARSVELADNLVLPTLAVSTLATLARGMMGGVVAISANFSEVLRIVGPLSMLNFLQLATEDGVLIKDGRSLELLYQVDTMVFDKTGTLTLGQPHVGQIHCCGLLSAEELLRYAATAEHRQTHPIAQAIQQEAQSRQLELSTVEEASYEIGYGLRVQVEGQKVRVGSARFMDLEQITIPNTMREAQIEADKNGYSLVYVAIDDQLAGIIELWPTIRPEAKRVIQQLKQRGLNMVIISGDSEQPTRKLATELGIDRYFAEVLPEDKADLVEQLQQQGRSVCFIGDGINDSIALKKANISISIRGASTIATDTAQVVLMNKTLNQLNALFVLADEYHQNQKGMMTAIFVPGVICIGGVFFLHFGIYSSLLLYGISLVGGVSNAMWPWMKGQLTGPIRLTNHEALSPKAIPFGRTKFSP